MLDGIAPVFILQQRGASLKPVFGLIEAVVRNLESEVEVTLPAGGGLLELQAGLARLDQDFLHGALHRQSQHVGVISRLLVQILDGRVNSASNIFVYPLYFSNLPFRKGAMRKRVVAFMLLR